MWQPPTQRFAWCLLVMHALTLALRGLVLVYLAYLAKENFLGILNHACLSLPTKATFLSALNHAHGLENFGPLQTLPYLAMPNHCPTHTWVITNHPPFEEPNTLIKSKALK